MGEERSFVFIGIDPGAANAGIAAVNNYKELILARHIHIDQIDKGVVGDYTRAIAVADRITAVFNYLDAAQALNSFPRLTIIINVEGPALARLSKGTIETGMVHMAIYHAIVEKFSSFDVCKVQVIVSPPKTLKKYVTGSGSADKAQMARVIRKRWGLYDAVFESTDACEATALAHMGFDIVYDFSDIGSSCQYYELSGKELVKVSHGDIRRCDNLLYFDSDSTG